MVWGICLNHYIYFREFFADKPVEKLLGYGIKALEINDDKIGRVMDDIYEVSLNKLLTEIGLNILKKYEIETKYNHLDSTSISVEGEYNQSENEEKLVNITYGYSKDIAIFVMVRYKTYRYSGIGNGQ